MMGRGQRQPGDAEPGQRHRSQSIGQRVFIDAIELGQVGRIGELLVDGPAQRAFAAVTEIGNRPTRLRRQIMQGLLVAVDG
jgi:hypothetical protein